MNKKIIYFAAITAAVFLVAFLFILFTKPRDKNNIFLNTIPLFENKGVVVEPEKISYARSQTPPQTNLNQITSLIDSKVSTAEREKLISILPVRISDFKTSTNIITTMNLYSLPTDPPSSIRLEIYGINFNNQEITGKDAISFKDSFIEVKKRLLPKNINLKNLQIIYGNRQYIQDTAQYWVNTFKLLD